MSEQEKPDEVIKGGGYLENLALIAYETNMNEVAVPLSAYCEMLNRLRAQVPRVMTLEEVKALPDYVFLEDRDTSYAHSIRIISRPALPQLVYVNTNGEECVGFRGPDDDTNFMTSGYGKDWRCWTSRPTDEQRGSTPWSKLTLE